LVVAIFRAIFRADESGTRDAPDACIGQVGNDANEWLVRVMPAELIERVGERVEDSERADGEERRQCDFWQVIWPICFGRIIRTRSDRQMTKAPVTSGFAQVESSVCQSSSAHDCPSFKPSDTQLLSHS
jgi:hypothetical protein